MKAILLDTHAFLWWISDDPRLSSKARSAISDVDTAVYFSAVSAFEIAVKARLGRLEGLVDPETTIARHIEKNHFRVLDLTVASALKVFHLADHHGDPFDRLLAAQSSVHQMALVTKDSQLSAYDIEIIW